MATDTTMVIPSCGFCTGHLPTIRLRTTEYPSKNVCFSICRACILVALREIEQPKEYPAVVEDRDGDLARLRGESHCDHLASDA